MDNVAVAVAEVAARILWPGNDWPIEYAVPRIIPVLLTFVEYFYWNELRELEKSLLEEWISPRHCEMPTYHMKTIARPPPAGANCLPSCLSRLHEHFEGMASSPELCQVLNTKSAFDWLYTDLAIAQMPLFQIRGLDSRPFCLCEMNLTMHRQRMISTVPERCSLEAVAKRLSFWGWMVQSFTSKQQPDCTGTSSMTSEQLASFHVALKYKSRKLGEVAREPYGPHNH